MTDLAQLDPRARLIAAAAEIFADKGYALASTREICKLAEVNVAAIHYYFGDKASLYREIFRIPGEMIRLPDAFADPHAPLLDGMRAWYAHIMSFAAQPDQATRMRLLILREQMQPSGVLEQGQAEILRPWHDGLLNYVAWRMGLQHADVELHHLVFSLTGIAMVLFIERAAAAAVAPGLLDTQPQIDRTVERLALHGTALIEAEQQRRRTDVAQQSARRNGAAAPHTEPLA